MTGRQSAGFTLIELLIVVAIVGVVSAVAIPGLLRARMNANESSAIGSLKAVHAAQTAYAVSGGRGAYAVSLATLVVPCPGTSEGFLSFDLGTDPVLKSGYSISLAAGLNADPGQTDCNGVGTMTGYYAAALPVTLGLTGQRGFATNQAYIIWQDSTGAVPPEPFAAAGTVAPLR